MSIYNKLAKRINLAFLTIYYFALDAAKNVLINQAVAGADAVGNIVVKNGTAPSANVDDTCHIYAADQTAGNSCPHVKTEDGSVVKLFQGAALTAADAGAINTGDATSDGVIANLRTRLGELEARLEANGLIAAN